MDTPPADEESNRTDGFHPQFEEGAITSEEGRAILQALSELQAEPPPICEEG